ncbi:hypothetical protein C8R41DRAFT_925294 [Lentinula lateritia]|uniref:Uncharacterized protein n=1 Tax=Lentinula lateritia TaxID=40482 RepID=A0ABQ8V0Z4_9AGAR|nr:hypothetical protein C8R41DRAFT_925294 [Lentinula lateritia]
MAYFWQILLNPIPGHHLLVRHSACLAMVSSQVRFDSLFTTASSIITQPITGKGPHLGHMLFTPEGPRALPLLFMLPDDDSAHLFSGSSGPLAPLPECSHLTSFDLMPSNPPPTVSLGLEASYYLQALQDNFGDVRHDASTQCLVGSADTRKGQGQEHYPTFNGLVARMRESLDTLKAASDLQTIACDMARFALDECDESFENVFVHCETMDKNTTIKYYMQGQGGHPQQYLYPDIALSCWGTGTEFSYHMCNRSTVDLAHFQGGSLAIPHRKHDPIVNQRSRQQYASWVVNDIPSRVSTPEWTDSPQVRFRKLEDLVTTDHELAWETGIPADSLLFSVV